jgi:glutathione S-transferase
MRTLFHLPLHAGSRIIRLLLTEKGLDFALKSEQVWERREAFLRLNPSGEVPVLHEPDGTAIAETTVIAEYVEEVYPERSMLGRDALQRAEVRRLFSWFDRKFNREVTANLVDEKLMKRFMRMGQPNSTAIRAGHSNIHHHLDYIAWLSERRNWLAGDDVSLADLAAAAHLSTVDYLGDVPWEQHAGAKDWYARIKSRPSMRPILADSIPGMPPPKHYADLDF